MSLAELFKFDPQDLEANRHGQLSESQQRRLMSMAAGYRLGLGKGVIILLGLVIVLAVLLLSLSGGPSLNWLAGGAAVAFLVIVLSLQTTRTQAARRRKAAEIEQAVNQHKIEVLHDRVTAGSRKTSGAPGQAGSAADYYLTIGDRSLVFTTDQPEALASAFDPALEYVAYGFPLEGHTLLLTIEPSS
jgi:membrane protein implicated in regulation of membrane protease activity